MAQREQKQHPAKRNRNNNNNYGCNYNSCVYVTLKPRMLYEIIRQTHNYCHIHTLPNAISFSLNGLSISMISVATYVHEQCVVLSMPLLPLSSLQFFFSSSTIFCLLLADVLEIEMKTYLYEPKSNEEAKHSEERKYKNIRNTRHYTAHNKTLSNIFVISNHYY